MQCPGSGVYNMPNVHICSQLATENEQLKRKLKRLKLQNVELLRQINDFKEKQRMDAMMKQFVTTRNMEVQTDPQRSMMTNLQQQYQQLQQQRKTSTIQENEKLNKMMLTHSNLMRRYEKELKLNVEHVETITTLNLKVNELEQKLKESQIHVHRLEAQQARKSTGLSKTPRGNAGYASSDDEAEVCQLRRRIRNLKKERDKLSSEKEKLKGELGGLDPVFFEEVEDLKFGLQQSARLNQEYERALRKLCTRFGVPYPCPENKLLSTM